MANFHPTQKFLSGKLETFMMYAAKDVNDGTYGTPPVYERILPIGKKSDIFSL